MDIPDAVRNSRLFGRLEQDEELLTAVVSLRGVAKTLADTVSRTVPTFTDHTVRHMDALWGVTDQVLVESEIASLTTGEAFLLACAFYLHDIGMAYAATEEGLKRIRSSGPYLEVKGRASDEPGSEAEREAQAVNFAVRKLHAAAAAELASQPVPGTDIFLLESRGIREAWGGTCGKIGTSHHWELDQVERELGSQGTVPLPGGRRGDLGYVASILRLVDYAHINRDRAPSVERAFRQPLEADSLVHWLAQEHVDGPDRDGADLVYRAAAPIADVDAWWLYYEMLRGLDDEIRSVRRYLDRRAGSQGRLSLQGVRGATSPEEAAVYVPTSGFLPIEVNLRAGSIERLVHLLAGESLYGPDPMAAVRELVQNARDAVMLKKAMADNDYDRSAAAIPIRVSLQTSAPARLEVTDPGIGMNRRVMTDYLIAIASDYWTTQFNADFPSARTRGFREAGKFGIGFLSVFMLGDSVTVESNRDGGERLRLDLRGVGRRGELRTVESPSGSGTAVRVRLRESVAASLTPLEPLVRVYAPMLPHAVEVEVDGQSSSIEEGWVRGTPASEFFRWTLQAVATLSRTGAGRSGVDEDPRLWHALGAPRRWLGNHQAEELWLREWPEFQEAGARLVASFRGISILCVRGLAIQPISTPGFVGVIDIESAIPDVSRREVADADVAGVLERATAAVVPQIVANVNSLAERGLLIDQLEFLARCVHTYGRRTVVGASLAWISFLKLPGETELVSCATLLQRLTDANSVFIAFGTGPWTAMRRWVALEPGLDATEPAVVIDDTEFDRVRYQPGDEEKVGRLNDLWPHCADSALFGTVLALAAEAWQTSPADLTSQDGWHHKGSTVWGRVVRP